MIQSIFKYVLATVFLLLFSLAAWAQSMESELKKDLLRSIKTDNDNRKPTADSLRNSTPRQIAPAIKLEQKYHLDDPRNKLSFKDILPENKRLKTADTLSLKFDKKSLKMAYYYHFTTVYNGNHFVTGVSQMGFTLNISGGGRKKLSKKTRRILREVYGMKDQ
ncbi:MAG: hypothetical protein BGN96_13065 [Bacteroidales bacterium 45-6]|nr:MAG: hypothetical protein BGN96_13065 [Bacteroidales bacterium 45-6]